MTMICYILVVCNGDMTLMIETSSNELTWYEEWFLFFEVIWHRSVTRWIDVSNTYKYERVHILRQVFDQKAYLVKCCRASWPTYVSYEEDRKLRKVKWNAKYDKKRVVMWDDTNVPFVFKPSRADNQRLTYSSYYGMNCAKGGVFLQLCGWLGVEELWVGATSDSHYQEHAEIFKRQENFASKDLVVGEDGEEGVEPFCNIFDKGYRCILAAYRAGKQECIQPIFAKSDRRFVGDETVVSASVASDRSGNERAVNICKQSGYIKRGLTPHGNPRRLNDSWLAWSFQANFMYAPVL
jgi:hypothetical protein